MGVLKTIEEINEKIAQGKAVVVTAEEMIHIVREKGEARAAREVDVVTTGTFAPMCSSSAVLNLGHTKPRIKLGGGTCYINGVPAYTGLAAVDVIVGATALPDRDPRNHPHPGEFPYGGGHVIEDLVAGRDLLLEGKAYGTDCYPRREIKTLFNIHEINEAILYNPRNCYQNYNVAVNLGDKTIYTYMGVLKPRLGNANYCSAGELSPLLNDPLYRTIGIGTRIFLGGGVGYVVFYGTQHNPSVPRNERGVPTRPSGTLAVMGDLKGMNPRYIKGVSVYGYGTSLSVGIGIPIPILDEELAYFTSVSNEEIVAPVVDYSHTYPEREPQVITEVSYAQLRSGEMEVNGKKIKTGAISSIPLAREVAQTLKEEIQKGRFTLTQPVERLPGVEDGVKLKTLNQRL